MIDLIITLGWFALITLAVGVLAYALYTFTPMIVDFVKAFIKLHSHDDDDWYL